MNEEQYRALEKKYFEGKTTLEEERLLKQHDEIGVFTSLDDDKEQMNWDFEDFLNKVQTSKGKVVPLSSSDRRNNNKLFWLAASIIILFGIGISYQLWEPTPSQNLVANNQSMEQTNDLSQEEIIVNDSANINNRPIAVDSSTIKNNTNTIKEFDVNQITPKRGRIKKVYKERMAHNNKYHSKKQNENTINTATQTSETPEYKEDYVVINGQKIKTQEEAINLTKYSIQMLSNKMSQTVAQTNAIENISLDY